MSSITRTTGSLSRNSLTERWRSDWHLPEAWPTWRIWIYLICQHRFYVFPADRRRAATQRSSPTGSDHARSQRVTQAHHHRESQRERALILLRASPASFQEWRRHQDFEPLWLTGADLRGVDLKHVDWRGCVLAGVRFDQADLTGARFAGAVLRDVSWTGATLTEVSWAGQDLSVLGLPADHVPATSNRWLKPEPQATVSRSAPMMRLPRQGLRLSLDVENRAPTPQEVNVAVRAGDAQRMATIQVSPRATRPLVIKLKRVPSGTAVEARIETEGSSGAWVRLGLAP